MLSVLLILFIEQDQLDTPESTATNNIALWFITKESFRVIKTGNQKNSWCQPTFQVPPSKKGAPNELGTLNNLLWVKCPHLPTQELFVLETTPRTTKIKD